MHWLIQIKNKVHCLGQDLVVYGTFVCLFFDAEKKQFIMQENNHTRSKMAHLQEMLRERQARRQARRNTKAPYPSQQQPQRTTPYAEKATGPENKERAISENCYPALKQDFLAV